MSLSVTECRYASRVFVQVKILIWEIAMQDLQKFVSVTRLHTSTVANILAGLFFKVIFIPLYLSIGHHVHSIVIALNLVFRVHSEPYVQIMTALSPISSYLKFGVHAKFQALTGVRKPEEFEKVWVQCTWARNKLYPLRVVF